MTTQNALLQRPIYSSIRKMVRAVPYFDRAIMYLVRRSRLNRASAVLKTGNLFPQSHKSILSDYLYSTIRTHRGIMQVVNLEAVLRYVESVEIEGAFVETGTYTGGASAYALLALKRLRGHKPPRHYFGFDSFEGMPLPTIHDGDSGSLWVTGRRLETIGDSELGSLVGSKVNKADYEECLQYLLKTGYPSHCIHLVKGWFQDTLPMHRDKIGPIAILRLDGDFYESTKVVFEQLYNSVVDQGVIIIDDYGCFEGCRLATDELFSSLEAKPHLIYVDNSIRYFIKGSDLNI